VVKRRPGRVAVVCAAAAVAVSGLAALSTIAFAGWEPSILVRMSETEPMAEVARFHDPDFVLVPAEGHYDGVYFYAIALDPFARNHDIYSRIDLHEYRYGHPGFGWLSRIFSLGGIRTLPLSMLAVALAGMGVAGWAVSRIAERLGRSPWWGLMIAVNPGLVFSVTVLTSEPVGVAIASVGLLLWLRGRPVVAAVAFAGACLVKELFVLVPAALFAWELLQLVRHRSMPGRGLRLALLAVSVVPLAWWYVYLRLHFGVLPAAAEPGNIGAPFLGWYDTFRRAVGLSRSGASQLGTFTIPLLAITAGAIVVGVVRALRLRSPFDVIFLLLALLVITLNWLILLYPKDVVRELALVPLLLPAVIAGVAWTPEPIGRESHPQLGRSQDATAKPSEPSGPV
jgi:hypothetical protein